MFKAIHKDVKLPTRAYKGDAGLDCYVPIDVSIDPKGFAVIPLGITVDLPEGHWLSIESKSSMLTKGIRTDGGIIDSGYKGEIKCAVFNLSERRLSVKAGEKLCQMILHKLVDDGVTPIYLERGEQGFGSSGK